MGIANTHMIKDHTCDGCSKRYFNLASNFVHHFENGYTWYILPIKPEIFTLKCFNYREATLAISDPIILSIENHCQAQSSNHLLLPATHFDKKTFSEHKIKLNLTKIEESYLNYTEFKLPQLDAKYLSLNELKQSAVTLDNLATQYEDSIRAHRLHSWKTYAISAATYLAYASLLFLTLFAIYKSRLCNCILRPFKFVIKLCFDNRPKMQPTAEYSSLRVITPTSDPNEFI